mgnify:FL=1|tara:strand:- start:93 stop:353 length:261 start_codon:yes stop_codon:yes gene_type:complete
MPVVEKYLERFEAIQAEDRSCLYMKFYEAVQEDEDGVRSMEKLYHKWSISDAETRKWIDITLAYVCGWTMGSLIEQVLDSNEEDEQ